MGLREETRAYDTMQTCPEAPFFFMFSHVFSCFLLILEETIAKGVEDPFSVVLKSSKLPMSLLRQKLRQKHR